MDELKGYLSRIIPGPIEETSHLEHLLAGVWHALGGDDGGMAGRKLIGRTEAVEWHPPILTLTIERHGGMVLGSTRTEIQRWSVDLDRRTAKFEQNGHRQLSSMATTVHVAPIAGEIADLIVGGVLDERLRWLGDGRVRVEVGRILPEWSGYKQTVQGRRKRLSGALIEALAPKGWIHLGRNTFRQTCSLT
jgi:hypothetical protein